MCDFAVGLSRQLNGSVIPSERKFYLEPASLMDKGWFFFLGILILSCLNCPF